MSLNLLSVLGIIAAEKTHFLLNELEIFRPLYRKRSKINDNLTIEEKIRGFNNELLKRHSEI